MRTKNPYSTRGRVAAALVKAEGMLTDQSNFAELELGSENRLPKSEREVDAFIKDRIRNYVECWLLPPLRQALKALESKPKKPE